MCFHRVFVWLQVLHVLSGHTDYVTDVALSGDGTKIVSASCDKWGWTFVDKSVRLWSVATGQASALQWEFSCFHLCVFV